MECIRGGRKLPQKYKKFTNKVEIDSNWLLMYKHHGRPKLVIPDEMKEEVLILGHSQVFSGHHGVFKTHRRILEVCWWPELYRDIETYIKSCRVCAMTKSYNRERGCLGKRQFPEKPLEFVSFDFIVELIFIY